MSSSNSYNPSFINSMSTTDEGDLVKSAGDRSGTLALVAILLSSCTLIAMLILQLNLPNLLGDFGVKGSVLNSVAFSPLVPIGQLVITIVAIVLSSVKGGHRFANLWNWLLIVITLISAGVFLRAMVLPLKQLIVDV